MSRIAEIRARLGNVAGPWIAGLGRTVWGIKDARGIPLLSGSITPPRVPEKEMRDRAVTAVETAVQFTAHAPSDVAYLLARLDAEMILFDKCMDTHAKMVEEENRLNRRLDEALAWSRRWKGLAKRYDMQAQLSHEEADECRAVIEREIVEASAKLDNMRARLDEAVALLRVYHQCRTCDGADVACGNCGGTGEDAAVAAFLAEVEK